MFPVETINRRSDWLGMHIGIPAASLPDEFTGPDGFHVLQRFLAGCLSRAVRKTGVTVFGMPAMGAGGVMYSLWPVYDKGTGGDSFCLAIQKKVHTCSVSYGVPLDDGAQPWLRCESRNRVVLAFPRRVPNLEQQKEDPHGGIYFASSADKLPTTETIEVGKRNVSLERRRLEIASPVRLILFLDESGDHSLAKVDPQYPVFVLAGAVFEAGYHDGPATHRMNEAKRTLFGREDIILHTAELARNQGAFERMKKAGFRQRVYKGLNRLRAELEYTLIACAIRKDEHLARYGVAALDPYMLSLDCVVERFVFMLKESNARGSIVAESRSPQLNNQLELAFLNLKINGTYYLRGVDISRRIEALTIREKEENITGLQVADLAASPIGRQVIGKSSHQDYRIVEGKFRCVGNEHKGYGLIVLPSK